MTTSGRAARNPLRTAVLGSLNYAATEQTKIQWTWIVSSTENSGPLGNARKQHQFPVLSLRAKSPRAQGHPAYYQGAECARALTITEEARPDAGELDVETTISKFRVPNSHRVLPSDGTSSQQLSESVREALRSCQGFPECQLTLARKDVVRAAGNSGRPLLQRQRPLDTG